MDLTKIITQDLETARKARELLESQALIEKAEIWVKEHPLYLFDTFAGYGKRMRSLKEELDKRRSDAMASARSKLTLKEIELLSLHE